MERILNPSLNSLKAFESAARHLSIKKAAEELNVTSAAVSHQIQQLEENLGAALFHRRYRSIEMTELGQMFFMHLRDGFEKISQAVEIVNSHRGHGVLSIDVPPSFSSQWLMPRLHGFVMEHPEIDVRVSTRMRQFTNLTRGYRGDVQTVLNWASESDIVITFGTGNYPGMNVTKLMPLYVTPLCTPQIRDTLQMVEDVANYTLLHDERGLLYENESFWRMWLRQAQVEGINDGDGPRFTHAALAIEAAIAGRGIVVTTPMLASSAIKSGQLVEPFNLRVPLSGTYCVVSRADVSRRPIVTQFREWLCKEGEQQADVESVPSSHEGQHGA